MNQLLIEPQHEPRGEGNGWEECVSFLSNDLDRVG